METESEEIKRLLRKNLAISEECLGIVKKMHRAQVTGRLLKVLKWLIIVALALGAYYYIQPYMDNFWQTMSEVQKGLSNLKAAGDTAANLPSATLEKVKTLFEGQ